MARSGAAGGYTWANSSNYQEFFRDKHVNMVTPKGSVSSTQADWYWDDPATGTNKWLTYMTRELLPRIDAHFYGTGTDAIAASYSGCPSTTGILGGGVCVLGCAGPD